MSLTSLEIPLAHPARWVVVGFGTDLSGITGLLSRLGPRSRSFPQVFTLSLVPPQRDPAPTAYILVVDHGAEDAFAEASRFVRDLAADAQVPVLISIGEPPTPVPAVAPALHLALTHAAGHDLIVASLVLALTGSGWVGVDLEDIRRCLRVSGPVRAWLWQGEETHSVTEATRALLRYASGTGFPPADIKGATVIPIVPPGWTLHDIVELASSVPLPARLDRALAAFTDDRLDPVPAVVVLTFSTVQGA